jgi:hypothetical protein
MYDPLIVDTFVAVKDKLSETFQAAESQVEALVATQRWRADVGRASDIAGALREHPDVEKLLVLLAQSLIQSTSARIVVLFINDIFRDEMQSLLVCSREGRLHLDVAMPVGARVTGWVAANGAAISNADATLDLPDQAKLYGLNRCLCVPVSFRLEQLAVVSLYTDDPRGFSERDSVLVDAAVKSVDLRGFREFLSVLSKMSPAKAKQVPTVH